MILAGPASAHVPLATPGCAKDGHATIVISLTMYQGAPEEKNTVSVTEGSTYLLPKTKFADTYNDTLTLDGTTTHSVVVHVVAFDDPSGTKGWTKEIPLKTEVCPQQKPPPSSSSVPPPPSSSTVSTPPPSSTTSAVVVVPTTTTAAPAVKTAALANTGVNAGLPLGIAGALVVIGGGLLFGIRMSARRRRSTD